MKFSTSKKLVILIVGVLGLGLASAIVNWPQKSTPLPSVYFYDLGTNQVYIEPPGTTPPVTAPSGKMGVVAAMYSCGSCDDSSERFIGYLQMETPEYKKAMETSQPITPEQSSNGVLLRKVDSDAWFVRESEAGQKLFDALMARCPEGTLQVCTP